MAGGIGLQQVASGTGGEHLPDKVLIIVHRENQHLSPRHRFLDLPCRLEPVQLGHREVENGDVGLLLLRQLDRLSASRGLGTEFPARLLLDEVVETTPHDFVIIGQKDADHLYSPAYAWPPSRVTVRWGCNPATACQHPS
jgi:hypothetical protein